MQISARSAIFFGVLWVPPAPADPRDGKRNPARAMPAAARSFHHFIVSLTPKGVHFTVMHCITFHFTPAQFTINSDTTITAIAPPQAAGPFLLRIGPLGQSGPEVEWSAEA